MLTDVLNMLAWDKSGIFMTDMTALLKIFGCKFGHHAEDGSFR